MSAANVSPAVAVTASVPRSDYRHFWRVLLAILAPISGLALAVANAFNPAELGGSTKADFADVAAHPTAAEISLVFSAIFIVTLVPSGVALMMAYRRSAPKFTTFAVGFATLGFLTGMVNPSTDFIALMTAKHGLDTSTGIQIADHMANYPLVNIALVPFFLTITLGRIVLGVLLWRVRLAPRWMAVAMLLATPVEFILSAGIGNFGAALAYALTAIGFASASVVLLHMSDDEFDLPPLPALSNQAGSIRAHT